MTTSSTDQLFLPYLPFLSNLSLTKKVYSLGFSTGHTIHNFLSTSHQINTIRNIYSTLKTKTLSDFAKLIPSALEYYSQWWLELVREDPVHVLIETLLIVFLLYLVLIRKKEDYRKKMQDRLSKDEIEDLLKEWKERGRSSLTGVPIEEWEVKRVQKLVDDHVSDGSSGSDSGNDNSNDNSNDNGSDSKKIKLNELIIESMRGSKLTVRLGSQRSSHNSNDEDKNAANANNKTMTVLNFATHDFLGMSCPEIKETTSNPVDSISSSSIRSDKNSSQGVVGSGAAVDIDVLKEASIEALSKYGCGSCGPRGFYGTIDTHLNLEDSMTNFLKTDGAILYSDGASASASTVAAFAKRGDLLVVDEGVYEALGSGVTLSRANVKYFKHNDMEDLRRVLERIQATDESLKRKKNDQRRFIVVEALYKNYGTICPLDELIKLKEEFCYRMILDESFSFGTLGKTGKGALEHFNLEHMRHAEIVTFSLENSMGSIGGITVGNEEVVDHQRLSGAGYCFSASLPPFLASAAQASLKRMEMEPELLNILRDNIVYCYDQMNSQMSNLIPSKVMITSEEGLSPIIFLQLTKNEDKILSRDEQVELFDQVATYCLENGILVVSTGSHVYDHLHKIPPPGIRITIMTKQSKGEIDSAIKVLKKAISTIL